jgi:hypothetical protein
MKNLLMSLIILTSISANAQIREVETSKFEDIGKVGGVGAFVSSMSIMKDTAKGGTNTYLWMYNNLKYQTITDIKSIRFTATEEDFNNFYQFLQKQINADKGTEKDLELGKSRLNFKTYKALGVSSLMIYDYSSEGFFYITSKQLDKLFGKN